MVKQAGWVRAGPPPALRATSARLDSRAGTTAAARGSRESRYPPPPDVLVQRPVRMPPLDPGFCKRQLRFVRKPIGFVGHLSRSEEHTSELQSLRHLVCRLLLE